MEKNPRSRIQKIFCIIMLGTCRVCNSILTKLEEKTLGCFSFSCEAFLLRNSRIFKAITENSHGNREVNFNLQQKKKSRVSNFPRSAWRFSLIIARYYSILTSAPVVMSVSLNNSNKIFSFLPPSRLCVRKMSSTLRNQSRTTVPVSACDAANPPRFSTSPKNPF